MHKLLAILVLTICLGACTTQINQDGPPKQDVDISKIPDAKPEPLAKSRYGNPQSYYVLGKTYHVLSTANHYDQRGIASWYGRKFHGRLTSTREPYNMFAMTAASPVLPIPSFVRVTNLKNGKSVIVKVNDRGPFADNRIMDLSYVAAKKLGYANQGTALVEVTSLNMDPPKSIPHQPELYMQIGSYKTLAQAKSVATQIGSSLIRTKSQIELAKVNRQTWYRLQLGPVTQISLVDKLYQELHQLGYTDAYTVVR
jgi:rare lipoprotein A